MKQIKALKFAVLATLSIGSLNAWAGEGQGVGNGGGSIVCRDSSGEIQKAYMLDLWQGANLPLASNNYRPLVIPSDDATPYALQVERVLKRLGRYAPHGISKVVSRTAERILSDIDRSILSVKMARIQDSSDFAVPEIPDLDCTREQLANDSGPNGLLIRKAVWDKLGETDKAALILHEAIYRVERLFGFKVGKSSDHTQALVAWVFSTAAIPASVIGEELYSTSCRRLSLLLTSLPAGFIPSHAHVDVNAGFRFLYGQELSRPLAVCKTHLRPNEVTFAVFSKRLIQPGKSGSVKVWDTDTGQVLYNGELEYHYGKRDEAGNKVYSGMIAEFSF